MPQIQGYALGSPQGQLNEATLTQSGTKFLLDTNAKLPDVSLLSETIVGVVKVRTFDKLLSTAEEILIQLKILNLHQEQITNEMIIERDTKE